VISLAMRAHSSKELETVGNPQQAALVLSEQTFPKSVSHCYQFLYRQMTLFHWMKQTNHHLEEAAEAVEGHPNWSTWFDIQRRFITSSTKIDRIEIFCFCSTPCRPRDAAAAPRPGFLW